MGKYPGRSRDPIKARLPSELDGALQVSDSEPAVALTEHVLAAEIHLGAEPRKIIPGRRSRDLRVVHRCMVVAAIAVDLRDLPGGQGNDRIVLDLITEREGSLKPRQGLLGTPKGVERPPSARGCAGDG